MLPFTCHSVRGDMRTSVVLTLLASWLLGSTLSLCSARLAIVMSRKRGSTEALVPPSPLSSSHSSKRQRRQRAALPITPSHPSSAAAIPETTASPSTQLLSVAGSQAVHAEDGQGRLRSWQRRPRTAHESVLLPLQFLLQAAHTAAFSSAVSRQCYRQLRLLAAESSVVVDEAVQARFCSRCDAVLVPGVSCSGRQRLDSGRTERWRRRQIKKRRQWERKKQKRRERVAGQEDSQHEADAVQQQLTAETDSPAAAAATMAAAAVRPQSVGKRGQRRAVRRTAEGLQRRQQQEAALQPVRFYQTVSVCSACGHENTVPGTIVKKGGRYADDVRNRVGEEAGARKRRREQARTETEEEAKARAPAGEKAAEASEQKRKKLRRQQSQSRAEKQRPRPARASDAAPEPFTGSLFFRFQRQVRQQLSTQPPLSVSRLLTLAVFC